MQWEYTVLKVNVDVDNPAEMAATLNNHGLEGWELVSATYEFRPVTMGGEQQIETCLYFFKRPKLDQRPPVQ